MKKYCYWQEDTAFCNSSTGVMKYVPADYVLKKMYPFLRNKEGIKTEERDDQNRLTFFKFKTPTFYFCCTVHYKGEIVNKY